MTKSLLIALVSIVSSLGIACPGGHVRTLRVNDVEVALINMTKNTIEITHKNARLVSVGYTLEGMEAFHPLCGFADLDNQIFRSCEFNGYKIKNFKLTENPNLQLNIVIQLSQLGVIDSTPVTIEFVETNFQISRAKCGGGNS